MKNKQSTHLNILGIESSCDDTSVVLIDCSGGLKNPKFKIVSDCSASQINIHRAYGGVVPEVAGRAHAEHIGPCIKTVMDKAKKMSIKKPDYIAVTQGPGLITSLMVGITAARTLSSIWKVPLVGMNHIEGHIYSVLLDPKNKISFPALVLIVSGGHTELILMNAHCEYKKIGKTLDDASGECFDKIAKMIGLPYPGGPALSNLAKKSKIKCESVLSGPKAKTMLPRPMLNSNNFNFSFAGLKTAALYYLRDHPECLKSGKLKAQFASEAEQSIIDSLVYKSIRAVGEFKPRTFILSGGVSANSLLRQTLSKRLPRSTKLLLPRMEFTTDNAHMIVAASYMRIQKFGASSQSARRNLDANPQMEL